MIKLGVFLSLLLVASASHNINQTGNEKDTLTSLAPLESEISGKENDGKEEMSFPSKSETNKEKQEIIISKDNIVPILRTIVLAFTHKKDPTYKEILKAGGIHLFKMAEKKVGEDKHMKGLLNILKKYVQEVAYEKMDEEQEDIVAELADEYLQKHKFQLIFPESLLLHQPEIEQVVAKRRELGDDLEGRQLNFDFSPYINRIANFTLQMRNRLQQFPIFNNLNLDRIGTTLSNIGNSFDEYIPALRQVTGLPDLGLSMGSLTALAAAGAMIAAPFLMSSFGASAREDDEDLIYTNRRVGTGGFPPEQFVEAGAIKRPEWIDEYENQQKVYSPKVNKHYSEPSSFNRGPTVSKDDEAYNKYLKEYNEWLAQYHNAVHLQKGSSKEYNDYYKKYREWYAQYYNEQFGENPPENDFAAPNAYEENNNIPNMLPPSNSQLGNSQYNGQQTQQQVIPQNQVNAGGYQTNQNPQEEEQESSSFQVIHVDENNNRRQNQRIDEEQGFDMLPQGSAFIESSSNGNIKYQYTNPRPIYRPTQAPFNPSTESGFKPLAEEENVEHKVFVFEKDDEEKESQKTKEEEREEEEDKGDKFSGFSSIKSISIFKPPEEKLNKKGSKLKIEAAIKKPLMPKISPVTSGVFKTTQKATPRFESTPSPVYKRPLNQSVRVVTSTSVVTSEPFVKKSESKAKEKQNKVTLTELLQKSQPAALNRKSVAAEERIDRNVIDHVEGVAEVSIPKRKTVTRGQEKSLGSSLPVYALDPFYGPRLSRTDAIFHQLSLDEESCREQVVCNMYKNPDAFTPLSDFLSRQLTVTYEQLKRPSVNDERILRFFRYLQAARAGQDGFNCLESYPNCPTDTTKLSYKPIVNAYKKVSVLMNAAGSS